ncbi:PaaI family thioesterase [Reyranella sp. CPCC 100927]|uniref:PaaI family thioesterase n=1 Tax=Reyranella sp. CPCC 100927 TaxID=2599616 RepID=UPI0011B491B6|nr:PaaI family thioesterase [Reyranella sp. CPCC 100927]TWT04048.1 PaaI family thioesterase [Reyranella sp. CPCC 100927]
MSDGAFAAPDPDFRTRVTQFAQTMPIFSHLGLRIVRLDPGTCHLELPRRVEFTQLQGYFMAGVVGMVGDIAGNMAGGTLLAADWTLASLDYTVKLLAPARGEALVAEGRTVRPGRTVTVNAADIFAVDGGKRTLCASVLMTAMNLPLGARA